MSTINKPFRKKDAMQLVTGQPVYMDDVIPQDCPSFPDWNTFSRSNFSDRVIRELRFPDITGHIFNAK